MTPMISTPMDSRMLPSIVGFLVGEFNRMGGVRVRDWGWEGRRERAI